MFNQDGFNSYMAFKRIFKVQMANATTRRQRGKIERIYKEGLQDLLKIYPDLKEILFIRRITINPGMGHLNGRREQMARRQFKM